jgi:4-hydroxy-tetrahydrodipicolinate synthase
MTNKGSLVVKNVIRGFWVAAATPLTDDDRVDHGRLAAHSAWLFEHGVDGLVLFGTTGEGPSFSAKERLETVAALLKHGIAPQRLALGAGFPAIPDSIALARDALTLGLRHVLVLPPYFYRDADPAGLEGAFATLIEGVGDDRLRATLYHIPQVSGVAIPPAVLAGLRARFGVMLAGIKDSSGNFEHFRAFRAAAPEIGVTIGNEADISRALAEGGQGTICGMANMVPDLVRAMFSQSGAAKPMQAAIALMQGQFVPTLKAALAQLTGEPGWARVRAPLLPGRAANGERVAAGLRALAQPASA